MAIGIAFLFLPVREWFWQVEGWIRSLGIIGPFVVMVIYIIATVLLVPGSYLTIIAGSIFGLWVGSAVVIVGANAGALCSFLLARTFLRAKVAGWAAGNAKFAALDRAIGRAGFKMVLLSRLSPAFPFTLLNYLLGLTAVRIGSYALANLIGMLPGTFLYVYLGAVGREALSGKTAGGIFQQALRIVGLLATVAVVVIVTRLARRAMAQAESTEQVSEMPAPEVR
jgi:uncharacterized membrane protein YdjX (TVP38/TMEM64 family)